MERLPILLGLLGLACAEQYTGRTLASRDDYAPFYQGSNGYRDPDEPYKTNAIVGMIIGFTVLGGLLLYAIVMICIDASKRKADYKQ